MRFTALLIALCTTTLPAAAQERSLNFAIRGGGAVAPSYPGADSFRGAADLVPVFGALRWGRLNIGNGIDGTGDNGLTFGGALRVISDRTAADYPELAGLQDVDTAVELGFRLTYQQDHWRAFGELRKGITGHSGVTGILGAEAVFEPGPRWRIIAGPRMSFGDSTFANTYFGVPTATANFATFDAAGGTLGAGFEVKVVYDLNDNWALDSALAYEQLLGDAADSPITTAGSRDQWSLRIGLRREFTLRF